MFDEQKKQRIISDTNSVKLALKYMAYKSMHILVLQPLLKTLNLTPPIALCMYI